MMIQRHVLNYIKEALDRQAAVALIGPRQVGKTTLALEIKKQKDAIYLDLESNQDRIKLKSPKAFFDYHQTKLIILDEIHKMPELFQELRGIIDENRRRGHRYGQFLILGSAFIDLLHQSGETLAGRIEYIEMNPLDASEINSSNKDIQNLFLRGGFPDSFLANSDKTSFIYRKNFIRTYLEREIPQFGPRIPATAIERLWTMIAHSQGQLINASKLAENLSLSSPTVSSYIDLLADLFLLRKLPPFFLNIKKRLVKSPRIYIRDSGFTHALLDIIHYDQLLGHPVLGSSYEGFVIENILSHVPHTVKSSFYRTCAGAEIDCILEWTSGDRWAIEIKSGLAPKLNKGFYSAIEDVQPQKTFVAYPGNDRFPLDNNTEVIGLRELISEIDQKSLI